MPLTKEIEVMQSGLADAALGIEALVREIAYFTKNGMDATDGHKRLVEMRRVQQSRAEVLSLTRVFSALSRDPRKGSCHDHLNSRAHTPVPG